MDSQIRLTKCYQCNTIAEFQAYLCSLG
uniref:Uncharacterized protein n=1 Tax=Anguilla anguilla TaxID=7936 RepID=A0A0E9TGL0_ANGAN